MSWVIPAFISYTGGECGRGSLMRV
jgi:hypothetical protein